MKVKVTVLSFLMLFIVIALGGCAFYESASKHCITRRVNVSNFTSVEADVIENVEYVQSADKPSALIYGPDNYVNNFDVFVNNNTLYIKMEKKNYMRNVRNVKIVINSSVLNHIVWNGVGNIIMKKLQVDNLKIVNNGVGSVKIASFIGDDLDILSTGVGSINVAGKINKGNFVCNGVGSIDADKLETKDLKVKCNGVGSITCYATDGIVATVNGVGSIKYKGSPIRKELKNVGIGSIEEY